MYNSLVCCLGVKSFTDRQLERPSSNGLINTFVGSMLLNSRLEHLNFSTQKKLRHLSFNLLQFKQISDHVAWIQKWSTNHCDVKNWTLKHQKTKPSLWNQFQLTQDTQNIVTYTFFPFLIVSCFYVSENINLQSPLWFSGNCLVFPRK